MMFVSVENCCLHYAYSTLLNLPEPEREPRVIFPLLRDLHSGTALKITQLNFKTLGNETFYSLRTRLMY